MCYREFKIDSDILVDRLTNRLVCLLCDKSYSKSLNIEECSTCEGYKLIYRSDDTISGINKRLDVYKQSTSPLLELYKDKNYLYTVDASDNIEYVTYKILYILEHTIFKSNSIGNKIIKNEFKFLNDEYMSIFHYHVDAKDSETVRYLGNKLSLEIGNIYQKIYNISSLRLLSQYRDNKYSNLYSNMRNFKSIDNSHNESFLTGFLGPYYNHNMIKMCIGTLNKFSNKHIMFEVEETIYSAKINRHNQYKELLNLGNTKFTLDVSHIKECLSNIPMYELHHGIDILKSDNDLDLSDIFEQFFENNGFNIGGLFIFSDDKYWKYRTNEFSDSEDYNVVFNYLKEQSNKLRNYLNDLKIECITKLSLEKVHIICKIN